MRISETNYHYISLVYFWFDKAEYNLVRASFRVQNDDHKKQFLKNFPDFEYNIKKEEKKCICSSVCKNNFYNFYLKARIQEFFKSLLISRRYISTFRLGTCN